MNSALVEKGEKMGQHKHNPTAIAAKNGELPPKEQPRLSKRQMDALIYKTYTGCYWRDRYSESS